MKNYRKNNLSKMREYSKKSYTKNIDKVRIYRSNKLKNDPIYRFNRNIRRLILFSFSNKHVRKDTKSCRILGCSFDEFIKYIENKFEPWMNWNNQGKYTGRYNETWQLDHIIPLNSIDNTLSEEERKQLVIKLNHHTNFQPLCSKVNLVDKHGKLDYYK